MVWRLFGAMLVTMCLQAQAPALDNGEPLTLRAYVNLVQIPVLVLSPRRLRSEPVTADRFRISIDSGPEFMPRRVRQEGSDAIRLVMMLDLGPNTRGVLEQFSAALTELSHSLTEKDIVSVSVLRGSSMVQSEGVPLTPGYTKQLAAIVADQLNKAAEPDAQNSAAPRLWDAVTLALSRFGNTQSRRVLLLVTDGKELGSRVTLPHLHTQADLLGVTVFALREQSKEEALKDEYVLHRDSFAFAKAQREGVDKLVTLTDLTGGATLETFGHPLGEGLTRVVRLIRERYILDFVRPSQLPAGAHSIEVRVRGKNLFVRGAGLGVPMPDPAIENDPRTVKSTHEGEPPVGKRRVIPPQ